jgi:pimeloyl-ACP methyl ester carboxylesterase
MNRMLANRSAAALLLALLAGGIGAQTRSGSSSNGLAYDVSGSGEAVVLIHAFSVDRRMWDREVAAFEKRFTVVRYDQRGHGDSVAPTQAYTNYEDLRALLDELGIERAALVGLSAGAEIAVDFALVYPERVTRLVLASPGLGGYELPPLTWAQPVFEAAGRGDAEGAARLWASTPIMTIRSNLAARETVAALVADNARLWTYRRGDRPLSPPAVGRLAEIRSPTLVIVGERDLPHIVDIAGVLDRGIAGAELVSIPNAGHIANLDAPAAFTAAVSDFLAR